MDITYEIAALVALIGLSGYFSGLEVALVSVRPSKIEQLIKNNIGKPPLPIKSYHQKNHQK